MTLLNDGDRTVYRYPGDFNLASSLLLMLPLGLGIFGAAGIALNNSEWDDILLIPLGICAGLVLLSAYGLWRVVRRRSLPRLTRALIFDRSAGRMYLSPDPWRPEAPVSDLRHLPSYGYDQFTGWDLREYTVSNGSERINRSTFYVVTLRKTDGGHFDIMESGFEPRARAVLRELASQIPLEAARVEPVHDLPLPRGIRKQERFQETLYTWNKAYSFGGAARGLFFLAVAAAGYFLVIGPAQGEFADLVRLSLGGALSLAALIVVLVAVVGGLRARGVYEYFLLRRGALEYGELPRDEARAEQRRIKTTLDLSSVVRVRYDRALDRRNLTALWFQKGGSDQGLFLVVDSLSEGEAVILERSLENDIRHYGGSTD